MIQNVSPSFLANPYLIFDIAKYEVFQGVLAKYGLLYNCGFFIKRKLLGHELNYLLVYHHHLSVMELGHLLTCSGLMYPEASSKVCHGFFCQFLVLKL
jgi:hypothetical protein